MDSSSLQGMYFGLTEGLYNYGYYNWNDGISTYEESNF